MDNIIIYKNENIDIENDFELRKALECISEHVVNKDFYYRNAYSISKNQNITGVFENKNLRRSYYLESNFNSCNLNGVGLTDSIFNDTHFHNCKLDSTNFESSYLFKCSFNDIHNCNFMSLSKSCIYITDFRNIDFNHCRLSDASFHNSALENCNFDNTSFDGTIFNDTLLDNVTFKNLNLEYTQFNNIHINNCALPFPTIPFIINGLSYLKTTKDKVYIKSAKKGQITKEEYIDLLKYLKVYYDKTNNFFPLANILISENNAIYSFEAIKNGICQSIFINNYRQLRNYCILANSCDLFDIHKKKLLVEIISHEFNNRLIDNYSFYYPITQHFNELNNILLNNNNASLIVKFNTNIKNNNYNTLTIFYKVIDLIVNAVGVKSNYSINFTYNSEADIIATINSIDTGIIVALITAFTTLLISGIKGIAHLPTVIKDFVTIKKHIEKENLDNERRRLENKKINLEIEKMEKEINASPSNVNVDCLEQLISNIEPILETCDLLNKNGAVVKNINYNAINVDINSLTEYTNNIIYRR